MPSKGREAPTPSAEAIEEIEQALGDIGRGYDFPMSRTRGGSASSRSTTVAGPPQPSRTAPAPPAPTDQRRHLHVPESTGGDSLLVPSIRPVRPRGATTPGLARIEEGSPGPPQVPHLPPAPPPASPPLPLLPRLSPLPADPITRWLMEEDFVPEVARAVTPSAVPRPRPARAPSTLAAFPSVSPALPAPSSALPAVPPARSVVPPEPLDPAALSPPLFPPPSSALPPVPPVSLAPRSLTVSPSKATREFPSASATATPTDVSRASSPGLVQELPQPIQLGDLEPNDPYGYPAPPPFQHNWETPNRAAARHSKNPFRAHRAGYTGPPIGDQSRPVLTTYATAQFAYYPMMSPYEAEAVIGGVGSSTAQPFLNNASHNMSAARAQMFPLLDHNLMSAEQAATAIAAAADVRSTIFIDRGVDLARVMAAVTAGHAAGHVTGDGSSSVYSGEVWDGENENKKMDKGKGICYGYDHKDEDEQLEDQDKGYCMVRNRGIEQEQRLEDLELAEAAATSAATIVTDEHGIYANWQGTGFDFTGASLGKPESRVSSKHVSSSAAKDGYVLEISCAPGALSIRPWGANSEYPHVASTGLLQGSYARYQLDNESVPGLNITTGTAVLYSAGFFARMLGTVEGGIEGYERDFSRGSSV
ncbi:hypothetical protein VTI74DRAFT_567 [Chaetomium olivicolor]